MLDNEGFDVAPIQKTRLTEDNWSYRQYLALGLAQIILILNDLSDNHDPHKMCTQFMKIQFFIGHLDHIFKELMWETKR